MNQLEYYLDLKNNIVSCYDPDVEFFSIYCDDRNVWTSSKISFFQFCHDYEYKEITFENAMSLCDDDPPDELYYEYLEMLFENGGIIKKRKINIIKESNADNKNEKVFLYIDGVKYQSINDENIYLMLDFKDHMITCKSELTNVKSYDLHVPYGIDEYTFILLFENNEIKLI